MLLVDAERKFKAFVATLPKPADYRDVLLGFYVPIFNATNSTCRRCLECGTIFALRTAAEVEKSRHCCEECAARASKRGVRGGKHYSANELRQAKAKKHIDGCSKCQRGKLCSTGERLLSKVEALDRKRGAMPPEYRDRDTDPDQEK